MKNIEWWFLFMNTLTLRHISTMVPHMLFWWGFVCISIYGITFGLNLQIFHIIWKSESFWLFFWPIMNTWTWVTSLVCCAIRSGNTSAVIVPSGHISPAKLYQKEADIYMGIVIYLLWAIKITAVHKWVPGSGAFWDTRGYLWRFTNHAVCWLLNVCHEQRLRFEIWYLY